MSKPEGYHEHHRQLRRGGDERPVNKLYVSPELHKWIQEHPKEAGDLGWIVSQYADPAEVVVTIPDVLPTKRKPRKPAEPRKRSTVSVRVPKDVLENGEEVLTTLIDAAREDLVKRMNWKDDVPPYYVLVAVLHDWLTS